MRRLLLILPLVRKACAAAPPPAWLRADGLAGARRFLKELGLQKPAWLPNFGAGKAAEEVGAPPCQNLQHNLRAPCCTSHHGDH